MPHDHVPHPSSPLRLRWLSAFALALSSVTSPAIEVTLGNLSQVYDGSPAAPSFTTNPSGLTPSLTYRNLSSPETPTSEVVFNSIPPTLALSYSSLSFASNSSSAVGNYLRLAGSYRTLESVDVVMVTWAKANDYLAWSSLDPNGYSHPVTLSLYQVTDAKQLVFLTEVQRAIFVPWRPLTLPNGDPYPENGRAFVASFDFPGGITLPEKVMALVSFNVQNAGFAPIGSPGPYNELNVAIQSSTILPSVGADADPGEFLRVVYSSTDASGVWRYPDTTLPTKSFLMGVHALSTQTKIPPVNAGTYEVTASISDSTYVPSVGGSLVINKAQAAIQIHSPLFYTGAPIPAHITTDPPDLALDVSYGESPTPPSALGTHDVAAQVIDPNYVGTVTGQYTVSPSFQSWIENQVALAGLPPDQAGGDQDPDHDGVPNLTEYALNLDPMSGFGSEPGPQPLLPRFGFKNGSWTFTYRRNLNAADCSFAIEYQSDLSQSAPWPVLTGTESILSDDGRTRLIEVALPVPTDSRQFYRLRIQR